MPKFVKASSGGKSPTKTENKGYFSFDSLVEYQYKLAIGDEEVSAKEWQQLVDAKTPLVHFRGQWMELDRDKMQEFLGEKMIAQFQDPETEHRCLYFL